MMALPGRKQQLVFELNYAIKEYIETVEEYTFENIVLAEIYENFSVDFKEIDL